MEGCRIKCTRQPQRVFWLVLSSLFFKRNLLEYRDFRVRRLGTTNYRWTSVVLCMWHWVESSKYRTLRLHYRQKVTREEAEREITRNDVLVFMFSSQKCKYFACDLILRIMNKFFNTWESTDYVERNW